VVGRRNQGVAGRAGARFNLSAEAIRQEDMNNLITEPSKTKCGFCDIFSGVLKWSENGLPVWICEVCESVFDDVYGAGQRIM